jgi:OHCU decarboxylase
VELDQLNRLDHQSAVAELLHCCGSTAWAERIARGRPYLDEQELLSAADAAWWDLDAADWLEAFAAHPRIGERATGSDRHSSWSREEQSGTADDDAITRDELATLNAQYEQRFGHVFLVYATGRTGAEMLEMCRRRLTNEPDQELEVAAGEQAKIMMLRIKDLLSR